MNSTENLVKDFIYYLQAERGLSGNTVESYKSDVLSFLKNTKKNIKEINREDIKNYLYSLHSSNFSTATVARKTSSLRMFFLFWVGEGLIEGTPMNNIQSPRPEKRLPKFLSADEVTKLIESVNTL